MSFNVPFFCCLMATEKKKRSDYIFINKIKHIIKGPNRCDTPVPTIINLCYSADISILKNSTFYYRGLVVTTLASHLQG